MTPATPPSPASQPVLLDAATLQAWPLPVPAADGDKEERGRVVIVAGSHEMPGAAILAADAALRAGVGKLTLLSCESVAAGIALAVPEARVMAMPREQGDWMAPEQLARITALAERTSALLVGPGMEASHELMRWMQAVLPKWAHAPVLLDAAAMDLVIHRTEPFAQTVLMTPHAGEMAHLTGLPKDRIRQAPAETALAAARQWGAVVALKGACTMIATPQGQLWRHDGGNVGLAVSGSGDTLAGLMAGLLARGASAQQAAAWAVALHARAGEQLARRWGQLGYLAREIAAEVPELMDGLMPK